jgi:hypothetical protein
MDDETLGSSADLPGKQETGFDDAVDRLVHVPQEASGVFATQFQSGAGQPSVHDAPVDSNAGRQHFDNCNQSAKHLNKRQLFLSVSYLNVVCRPVCGRQKLRSSIDHPVIIV